MMPAGVIQVRHELCNCEGVKHDDPCAACPNGHFGAYTMIGCDDEQKPGLGTRIERALNKIPGIKSLPCHDKQTGTLKPESPCGKTKARLNAGEPVIPTILKRITGK